MAVQGTTGDIEDTDLNKGVLGYRKSGGVDWISQLKNVGAKEASAAGAAHGALNVSS